MFKKITAAALALILTAAMCFTAFAASFTPSVTAKEAPEVVEVTVDGKTYSAVINDASGKLVMGVPGGELIVTPVSRADSAEADIKAELKSAYNQIKNAADLGDLSPDLAAAAKAYSADLKTTDLVVRDLFDVTVRGAYEDALNKEGNTISITFKLTGSADALVAVLHNIEGTKWETIPEKDIKRNDDNTVTVTFNSLSAVAFVYDAGELGVDANAPKSPQTSDIKDTLILFAITAGAAAAGCGCVALFGRSKKKAD